MTTERETTETGSTVLMCHRGPVQPVAVLRAGFGEGERIPYRVDIIADQNGGEHWFYGYVENQFDPVRTLVRADTLEDAYETLMCEPYTVRDIAVTADELEDYGIDPGLRFPAELDDMPSHLEWNDNGDLLDTESVCMFGPVSVRIMRETELPAGF